MKKHPFSFRLALCALAAVFALVSPAARAVEYVAYFGPVTVDTRSPAVAPAIVTQPTNQTVVAGGGVVFAVSATGTAPLAYQWRFNGTNLAGATSTNLTLTNVQLADGGPYTVVVSNAVNSVTSAPAVLTVWTGPTIVAQPQSRTNAAGTSASFSVTATGTAPLSYQWQRAGTNLSNGGLISGATTTQLTLANVRLSDAGDYRVVVSNAYASTNSAVATLTVTCPAITLAPATLPGGTVGVGYSQALTASGSASSYTFALTSGSLPAGLGLTNGVISGTPAAVGTNTLTVAAADTNGCSGSRSYALGVRAAVSEGISNVRVSQRAGTNLVDLYYDLFTTTTNPLVVAVAISTNGGSAYDLPATHFTGDVGSGVTPGTNKWVVWDAGQDWPERFSTNVFFRLTVSDVTPVPPGMVLIPAGSFTMGDSVGDADLSDPAPVTANVSSFYMDTNLVTWSQWQEVYAYATDRGYVLNAGAGKAGNHPVWNVDWYDCLKWCNARSEQAGKVPVYYTDALLTQVYTNGEGGVTVYVNWGAKGYRLPTEAEWEKAARGGLSGQRFPWGNLISQANANYYGGTSYSYDLGPNGYNAIGTVGGAPFTSPVGSFAANGYGLEDMAGNVWQWCWDWYGTPYAGGADPRGAASGSRRVFRGGSWYYGAYGCRSAYRYGYDPAVKHSDLGFRVVLAPGQ